MIIYTEIKPVFFSKKFVVQVERRLVGDLLELQNKPSLKVRFKFVSFIPASLFSQKKEFHEKEFLKNLLNFGLKMGFSRGHS